MDRRPVHGLISGLPMGAGKPANPKRYPPRRGVPGTGVPEHGPEAVT